MTIARRWFLQATWGTLFGLAVPLGRTRPARAAGLLAGVFRDPAAARAVGRAVLAAEAVPAQSGPLIEGLLDRHPDLGAFLGAGDRRGLAEGVRRAVRDDFAAGRTRLVDGWLLSASEADLYAIAYLT